MSVLQISLFGRVCVTFTDTVTPLKLTHTSQLILTYLLLHPHQLCPREQLMGLFWGEHNYERARKCLNSAVWRLRSQLEPRGVQRGTYLVGTPTGEVGFNWGSNYSLDVEIFEAWLTPFLRKPIEAIQDTDIRAIEDALVLYKGELATSFYEDWALRERERLRSLYLNCLARLMDYYAHCENFEASIAYGRQILNIDPVREEIHRELMRLYLRNGQRALALRQYESCCAILEKELDVPPMAETQALYHVLVDSSSSLPRQAHGPMIPPLQQEALHELQIAMQRCNEVHMQLQKAMERVAHLLNHPND